MTQINKEQAESRFRRFVEEHGRLPMNKEFGSKYGIPSVSAFQKAVDMTLREYKEKHYPDLLAQADAQRQAQLQNLRYTQVKRPAHKWEPQEAMDALRQYVDLHGRLPLHSEFGPNSNLPSVRLFEQLVGMTIAEYKKAVYPKLVEQAEAMRKERIGAGHKARDDAWSKEKAITAVERFVEKHHRMPTNAEMSPDNNLPANATFQSLVGISPREYGMQRHPDLLEQAEAQRQQIIADKNRARAREQYGWNRETVLASVNQFIKRNGRLPIAAEHTPQHGLPTGAVFLRVFGQWPAALYDEWFPDLHAEIEDQRRTKISATSTQWTREGVLQAVEAFVSQNNRIPLAQEFRTQNELPSYMIFCRLVGTTPPDYFMSQEGYRSYYHERKSIRQEQRAIAVREQIDAFIAREKRPPHFDEFSSANEMPSYGAVADALGMTLTEYFEENYPEYHQEMKPYLHLEKVLAVIREHLDNTGELPWCRDFHPGNGLPTYHSILTRFGLTPNQFLEKFFPDWFDRNHRRPIWDRSRIETQMVRFFEEHGRPPYSNEFYNRNGLPVVTTFLRHMKELPSSYCLWKYADYYTTRREARESLILESYETWIKQNGRCPGGDEIIRHRLPGADAIKTSFGCTATEFLREHFPEYPSYALSSREVVAEQSGQEYLEQDGSSMGMSMTL